MDFYLSLCTYILHIIVAFIEILNIFIYRINNNNGDQARSHLKNGRSSKDIFKKEKLHEKHFIAQGKKSLLRGPAVKLETDSSI